ncbi:MAG: DUF885 domain-containing protein [Blastomonas sp.]
MRRALLTIIGGTALAISAPAMADAESDFHTLLNEHWQWVLSENPVLASSLGVAGYDGKVGDNSLAAQDRSATMAQKLLDRLNAIPVDALSPADRTNHLILARQLDEQIRGNAFPQRVMLFTTYYGWHQGFAGIADDVPLYTLADYRSYLDRIRQYPQINDNALAISDEAIAKGFTLPCVVLNGFENGISGVIAEDPAQSRFYKPFAGDKPATIADTDWTAMQAEARAIITDTLNPAYQKHLDWYLTRYKPACAKAPGISAQPGGRAYYDYQIGVMTTTGLDADQIHRIGLDEVARIRAEMEKVASDAGYASREAFIAELRSNPRYYATTPEELLRHNARQAKQIDGLMPRYFGRLARLPYGIREIPAETAEGTTTAYYSPGSPASGIAGNYYVNTSKLDQRPLWEIPALTAHESVPGHHHQIALQQELELPDFRRYGTHFTAFTEGWGLYAERLGIEMGLYDTPEKNMGRLSYEMWRACRLVVDTGIHAKGWSKQQAVDFMLENTALSPANIEAEVNRYISWPGQALAYKLGELKIRELRARAETALGDRFDIRAFHDTVLGQGGLPLSVLEAQVDRWIAEQLKGQ